MRLIHVCVRAILQFYFVKLFRLDSLQSSPSGLHRLGSVVATLIILTLYNLLVRVAPLFIAGLYGELLAWPTLRCIVKFWGIPAIGNLFFIRLEILAWTCQLWSDFCDASLATLLMAKFTLLDVPVEVVGPLRHLITGCRHCAICIFEEATLLLHNRLVRVVDILARRAASYVV